MPVPVPVPLCPGLLSRNLNSADYCLHSNRMTTPYYLIYCPPTRNAAAGCFVLLQSHPLYSVYSFCSTIQRNERLKIKHRIRQEPKPTDPVRELNIYKI